MAVTASGCLLKHSPQSRTFVLDALTVAAAPDGLRAVPAGSIGVLKVSVPGWIDRPQLTERAPNGQVVTDEFARWGEPVTRGIQRVVTENLAALLPDRWVTAAPFSTSRAIDLRVDLAITEAARQADGTVLVEARWAVLGPKDDILAQRRTAHRATPRTPGPDGIVTGTSDALAALSREIAAAIKNIPPAAPAPRDN
jgi:uncharacterized lipoprotein YmbA